MNWELIVTIVSSAIAIGLGAVLKTLIKEVKEVASKYKEFMEDDKLSQKEADILAKESLDVILEAVKFWYLIKRAFGKR